MSTFLRKFASVLIICAFFLNIVTPIVTHAGSGFGQFSGETQKNFENGVVMCAATAAILMLIGIIASSLNVPTNDTPTNIKETILDCLFWAFKNAIIQEMTGSTVQWVQTGMNGNPAFVQNVSGYLRSVADREAGSYLQKVAPFLCSPFRADIQLQLNLLYKNSSGRGPANVNGSCSISESVENVEAFLGGDFYAGGWEGWQSVFSDPQNNPYGAYFEARDQLALKISSSAGEAEKKISFGNGFLSKEVQDCFVVLPEGQEGPTQPVELKQGETVAEAKARLGLNATSGIECNPPKVMTPGAQVKNSLEQTFGVNLDQIATADEFDEIFSLLAAWLVSDILTQDGGLAEYDSELSGANEEIVWDDSGLTGGGEACKASPSDSNARASGETIQFEQNGTFLTTTPDDTVRDFYFGEGEDRKYTKVVVDFDVTVGQFTNIDGSYNYHELFYLTRGDKWWNNLIGHVGLKIKGADGSKLVSEPHFAGACDSSQTSFEPSPGDTFHVHYEYDTQEKAAGVDITSGSSVIVDAWSDTTASVIESNGTGFRISIGGVQDDNGEYQVALGEGWEFSNLNVTLEYAGK